MSKNLKKSMISSLVMLIAAIMCLTGVTYAWFTTSTSASVKTIDVKVQAADGLLVSLTGAADSEWKSHFSWDELTAVDTTVEPTELLTISTNGKPVNGALNFFSAELVENSDTMIHNVTAASAGYIKFDLYIKNLADDTKIIDLNDHEAQVGKTTVKVHEGSTKKGGETAARIGFIQHETISIDENETRVPVSNGTAATVYEPNAETRYTGENGAVLPYTGLKAEGTGEYAIADESAVAEKVTTITNETTQIFELAPQSVTKVTVYIWLEGQDADCINAIASSEFDVDLIFGFPKPEAK